MAGTDFYVVVIWLASQQKRADRVRVRSVGSVYLKGVLPLDCIHGEQVVGCDEIIHVIGNVHRPFYLAIFAGLA